MTTATFNQTGLSVRNIVQWIKSLKHENDALRAEVQALSIHPVFGCLTPTALRRKLNNVTGPVDVVFIDGDKWHEMNAVLGYENHSALVAICTRAVGRNNNEADVFGQYGGDEFLAILPVGDGPGFVARLQMAKDKVNAQLTVEQREAIAQRTGGLIDGVSFTCAVVQNTTDVHMGIDQAHGAVEQMKSGGCTGNRATDGVQRGEIAILK